MKRETERERERQLNKIYCQIIGDTKKETFNQFSGGESRFRGQAPPTRPMETSRKHSPLAETAVEVAAEAREGYRRRDRTFALRRNQTEIAKILLFLLLKRFQKSYGAIKIKILVSTKVFLHPRGAAEFETAFGKNEIFE